MSFKDEINFCLNFLKIQENSSDKSCIYSPASILNALAMVYAGSDKNSAEEIAAVIGKDKADTEIINYYSNFVKRYKGDKDNSISDEEYDKTVKALFTSIDESKSFKEDEKRDWSEIDIPDVQSDGAAFEIIAANKIFVDKEIHLLDSFCKIMKEKFDGKFQQVNFREKKEEAVTVCFIDTGRSYRIQWLLTAINKFVKDTTNQKIEKVFEPDDIRKDTAIVLVNALYFIGKWTTPFYDRRKGTFYSKIPREIDFMNNTEYNVYNYTEGKDWKCLGIPYRDRKVWMFIVLPNEKDGLQALIEKMDYSMFIECTKSFTVSGNVVVTMPVFEVSGDFDLITNLKKLGIHDIFDAMASNLSKMIDINYHESCYIYKAVHKAVIKVDEYGTEAAAFSSFAGVLECMPNHFNVDHPFMYFIVSADRPPLNYENKVKEDQKEREPTEILFAGTFY